MQPTLESDYLFNFVEKAIKPLDKDYIHHLGPTDCLVLKYPLTNCYDIIQIAWATNKTFRISSTDKPLKVYNKDRILTKKYHESFCPTHYLKATDYNFLLGRLIRHSPSLYVCPSTKE